MKSPAHPSWAARAPLAAAVGLIVSVVGAGAVPGLAETDGVVREVVAAAEPCLSVYAEPDTTGEPVRCLSPGHRINLLESRDDWARVRLPDAEEGWVVLRLIRPAGGQVEGRRISELEAALASAAKERAGLQRGISTLRSEFYGLILENERIEAAVSALTESESEANRRIRELEEQAGELTSRWQTAEKQLSETEAGRIQAVGELEALQVENGRLLEDVETERSKFELEISAFQSEIDLLRAANEQLESAVAAAADSGVEPGGSLELLVEALASTEAERLRFEKTTLELQTELDRLRDINEWLAVAAAERITAGSMAPGRPAVALSAAFRESVEFTQAVVKQSRLEGTPIGATSPLAREATAIVEAWAGAWSEQRVEDYLSFYSSTFEPAAELSLDAWEALRRKRVSDPERIEVLVAMADLRALDEDRVEVVFLQSYESDRMADVVVKTLSLVREDGTWKIDAERVRGPWKT